MTLTKSHIVDAVQNQLGFQRSQSAKLVETILEILKKNLESGEDILISGFGKLCVKEKKERKGRNPATGEDLTLDKRRVVVFRCSDQLRKKING